MPDSQADAFVDRRHRRFIRGCGLPLSAGRVIGHLLVCEPVECTAGRLAMERSAGSAEPAEVPGMAYGVHTRLLGSLYFGNPVPRPQTKPKGRRCGKKAPAGSVYRPFAERC